MPRFPRPQNTESIRSQYAGKPATGRFGFVTVVAIRVMVTMPRNPDVYERVVARAETFKPVPAHPAGGREWVTNYADISVKASVENVQNLVQHAFVANGFDVKWENATRGKAEKGSKGANLMLGALAQYYGIDFEIFPQPEVATLRLHKSNSGWAGGYLGARKVEKQFDALSETMAAWFRQQGALLGVQKK